MKDSIQAAAQLLAGAGYGAGFRIRGGALMMRKLPITMIRFYQKYISPYKFAPSCKYIPTCSQYALEAIQKYGCAKGSLLAGWRILRCNPFSKGGFDPVP